MKSSDTVIDLLYIQLFLSVYIAYLPEKTNIPYHIDFSNIVGQTCCCMESVETCHTGFQLFLLQPDQTHCHMTVIAVLYDAWTHHISD